MPVGSAWIKLDCPDVPNKILQVAFCGDRGVLTPSVKPDLNILLVYLLYYLHLLWAQVSVYGGDALHTVLPYDARCKRIGDDARGRLKINQTYD